MTWHLRDEYHMVSDPRGYTIAKFRLFGELLYEAWESRKLLATRLPSAAAAREVVEREVAG